MYIKALEKLFESRFWSLALKEVRQILRNRQLIFLLVFPPTIQLLIFGAALNPEVRNLKLGVVNYARSLESRELIAALTVNHQFVVTYRGQSQQELADEVRTGRVTAGIVIPPDFDRAVARGGNTEVQVLVDAVDANTAGIAGGNINQIINSYSRNRSSNAGTPAIEPQVATLYNPGLISSWFFVPGVLGLVLTLTSTLISTATVVREKDSGTLEQLLMTPADPWEILLAKIVPLFVMLMGVVLLALTVGRVVFGLPFRGNFLLFLLLSGVYIFVGIGLGIFLATVSPNQQRAQLLTFFFNLPLVQTSGAIAPIESMPSFFQWLSLMNPLRHYITISRGIILKGVGLEVLWPHVLTLAVFAALLLAFSINRFRSQLS
ncbi:ABC transporter permease [Anthocerotibacter panamensis]|uniref:ABC transporter permease n=1 Tax=Anthocerotibacter panamensis TaxID=2857077 RepID=UPI001FD96AED|nr:ABC transporter permease [Anthocerotibacter panamensis]